MGENARDKYRITVTEIKFTLEMEVAWSSET
jgi:hypothetical protein